MFSFQYPASVFRGAICGFFFGGGAGFGGGKGTVGVIGPGGACAKREFEKNRNAPHRNAQQAMDLNLSNFIGVMSPGNMPHAVKPDR